MVRHPRRCAGARPTATATAAPASAGGAFSVLVMPRLGPAGKSPIPVAPGPIMTRKIPDSESDSAGIGNREPPASRFGRRKRETVRPRLAANHDRKLRVGDASALPCEYSTASECTLAGTILHGLPVDVALSPSNADSQAASGLPPLPRDWQLPVDGG
jgi:hypothetical protein